MRKRLLFIFFWLLIPQFAYAQLYHCLIYGDTRAATSKTEHRLGKMTLPDFKAWLTFQQERDLIRNFHVIGAQGGKSLIYILAPKNRVTVALKNAIDNNPGAGYLYWYGASMRNMYRQIAVDAAQNGGTPLIISRRIFRVKLSDFGKTPEGDDGTVVTVLKAINAPYNINEGGIAFSDLIWPLKIQE